MDDRTRELIHGDIDGANSPEEQRELIRRMSGSAEARAEHERMRALAALLAAQPAYEPPADLRAGILARAAQLNENQVQPAGPVVAIAARSRRRWLGPALAMAATVAGVAFLLSSTPELPEIDARALAGTLGAARPAAPARSLAIDERLVAGTISLQSYEQGLLMELDLETGRPVSLVVIAEGATLTLAGVLPIDGLPARAAERDGGVRVLHSGRQHYALALAAQESLPQFIGLEVYEGSRLIARHRLETGAAQGPARN